VESQPVTRDRIESLTCRGELRRPLRAGPEHQAGRRHWRAPAKIMYAGRARYSEPVEVIILGQARPPPRRGISGIPDGLPGRDPDGISPARKLLAR